MAAVMRLAFLLSASIYAALADEVKDNPLGKVLTLMIGLEAEIVKQGEAEAKAFKDFFQWCDTAAHNLHNEIKISSESKEKLSAKIDELKSDIEVADSKVGDLSASIARNEAELKATTALREREANIFAASEKQLEEGVGTLDRALAQLTAEVAKNPAALTQIDTTSMSALLQSLSVVVDAAGLASSDQKQLVAFVQARQSEDDGDELDAPAASSYKAQSGNIIEMLADLKEKAESELADARKAEASSKHNFQMMKQSLDDAIAADTEDINQEKAGKASAAEEKGAAEGDLAITVPDLNEDKASLDAFSRDCMTAAGDHEATVAARTAELKVIATAKKILQDSSSGAAEQTYSFLQAASMTKVASKIQQTNSEVVALVRKLAKEQHSTALAELASRISAVIRYGGRNQAGPFEKIKELISSMITKLEQKAMSEATEKTYCDSELAKTEAKKGELGNDIERYTTKIDKAAAQSAELKEEAKELHFEVALLSKTMAELESVRQESHANYLTAKASLQAGLSGVRNALGLLRDYYGGGAAMIQDDTSFGAFMQQPSKPEQHVKNDGAGSTIINILEVLESDFATHLSKTESEEADTAEDFAKIVQEKKERKQTKEAGLNHKTKEIMSLEKSISEISSDSDNSRSELAAVLQYDGKVKERCLAPPRTYEERKERRSAELSGLKDALAIIETETSFLQRKRRMRGSTSALQ